MFALLYPLSGEARGVSPYLPMNLEPGIQRQIEMVLVLAGKPLLRRPIAAAVVLDALPRACEVDADLCAQVRQYLQPYKRSSGVTDLRLGLAVASGDSNRTIPNQHGLSMDSPWQASAGLFYQPSDYLLMTAGAVANNNRVTPTGSVLSIGFDWAQLDIGYRDHWLSPLTDSSMLISTQPPTLPSVTISNYQPLTRFGISYEIFLAKMSRQENISYFNTTTSGAPRLAGLQLGLEPALGYAVAINRVMQYGGGARGSGGFSQFREALFTNSNRPDSQGQQQEFGNQVASLTSSMIFPGAVPFAVRVEYAGEDNAYAGHYLLGATDLSLGLDFPKLWSDFDLTYEISEWQPDWYTHHLYLQGLVSNGHAIGHWFGDERQYGDAIGGHSQMLRLGWRRKSGDYLQATYRNLAHDSRWVPAGRAAVPYKQLHELGLSYSGKWRGHAIGADVYVGRDVFGETFARLAASFDVATSGFVGTSSLGRTANSESGATLSVDIGLHRSTVNKILDSSIPNFALPAKQDYHLGVGARRRVSNRSDLGAKVELDRVDGHSLLSLRALDYRYRLNNNFALAGFFGAARYAVGLPAYGYYWGGGLQWMDIVPRWDLGLDIRHHEKLGRDKVLFSDPPSSPDRTRVFFDVNGMSLYLSRRFEL